MREAGRSVEGLPLAVDVGSYVVGAHDYGVNVPDNASGHTQAEITSPAHAASYSPEADTLAPAFIPPTEETWATEPWTTETIPLANTETTDTVPPVTFLPPAIGSAPESASPEGNTPAETGQAAQSEHSAETARPDTGAPSRQYAHGQIRALIREASALLAAKNVDIRDLLHTTQARLVDGLLSEQTNEAVAAGWQTTDVNRVSRVGRAVLGRLEKHPIAQQILPEGMFEPQGAPATRDQDPSSFGARLRELRESRGLTQQQLADMAGMSVSAFIRLEVGKSHPPVPSAEAVLNAVAADEETYITMLLDYEAERQEAHVDRSGKPARPPLKHSSYSRDALSALEDADVDVPELIATSDLPKAARNNLREALANGLFNPDKTLSEVAEESDIALRTLQRAMRQLVEYAGYWPELAPLLPEAPSAASQRERPAGIGAALNDLRGPLTVAELSHRAGISQATCIRFTKDQTKPTPAVVNSIITAMEGAGRLAPEQSAYYRAAYAADYNAKIAAIRERQAAAE